MQTETDLQYPIGKFHRHGTLTDELRAKYIEQIEILPARLRDAVSGLNEKQLETPYRPGGWTVRQVVHHVADSHMNAYVRFKLTLTEDEPEIKPYLEAKWAELPDAKTEPVEVSLKLLEALHVRWVKTLRTHELGAICADHAASGMVQADGAGRFVGPVCVARQASRGAYRHVAAARRLAVVRSRNDS